MKNGHQCRKLSAAFAALSLAFIPTHAQQEPPANAPLTFEVATVKRDEPNKMIMTNLRVYPGGRLVIHGYGLRRLTAVAFDLSGWQLVGGPKWMEAAQFDVEGKPPEELRDAIPGGEFSNNGIQDGRVRSMLQALLIERFHLKFHMETQPGTTYLLKRGAGPLRLEAAELNLYTRSEDGTISPTQAYPTGDVGMASGVPVAIYQTSMHQLADVLGGLQGVPVTDQTGLVGFYNFKSRTIVTDEDFKNGGPMHLLVEAVPEMGLRLVKAEGLVQKFVLDDAQPPTDN